MYRITEQEIYFHWRSHEEVPKWRHTQDFVSPAFFLSAELKCELRDSFGLLVVFAA